MDATPLETLARWSGGTLISGDPSRKVSVVCSDSRRLGPGDLFVALRGEKFDAHTFLAEAARLGAAAAIVEQVTPDLPGNFGIIKVANSLIALQRLSAGYRQSLSLRVVGITGSNGKTSTKDLAAAVLGERFRVTKTQGNLNNHIGLPLTMLSARGSDEIGVFEMGMNHPGEIAPLAALAKPDVAIITNIGVAHIEFMKTREAIALEKGMLAEALPDQGTVILSARDEFTPSIAGRTKARAVLAGIGAGEVQANELQAGPTGTRFQLSADGLSVPAEVPVPGEHMVQNAVLAAAVGRTFGLSLEESAAGFHKLNLSKGRLELKYARGIQILDDTYNANPDSMAAALRTLASLPTSGRRIAVLGAMGELGAQAESGHRSVGETAARERIDCVITVGEAAALIAESAKTGGVPLVREMKSTEEAAALLNDLAKTGDLVLIKGSRSAKMERIVEALLTS